MTGGWPLVLTLPAPGLMRARGQYQELGHLKPGQSEASTVGFKISAVQEVPNSARDCVLFSPASHVARVTSHQPVSEVQIMLRVFTGLGGAEASQVCC